MKEPVDPQEESQTFCVSTSSSSLCSIISVLSTDDEEREEEEEDMTESAEVGEGQEESQTPPSPNLLSVFDSNLQHRLVVAEELLRTEMELNLLVHCPFRSVGCEKITRTSVMRDHRDSCLFRPVQCPKQWFSLSCSHSGPLYTIQQHARYQHNLHQGITVLQPGLIASKMFDTSANRSVSCLS